MARQLQSLNALKAFEAAARHTSFSLAAAELNVTHAAVSRHIRDLEASLGAKLFQRTGRGVQLTEHGQSLGRSLTPAFDLLEKATEQFTGTRRRRRTFVISAEISFAALWLVPRLGNFTSKYPDVDLELDPTNRLIDFRKEKVDLGIRYGNGDWRDVTATKLLDSVLTPVCSPALLKKTKVRKPADLARVTLLQEDPKHHWRDWLEAAGVAEEVVPSGPVLKGHLEIAAAEAGQGFSIADLIQAGDGLLGKRLVGPFDTVVRHHAYYVVRGAATKESKTAAAFRTWLAEEIEVTRAALREMGYGHLAAE
jgi:LysR family transcriptional regulator, glycine cleavage system transcriptional activator